MVNLSLLVSQAKKVGIWTYESHATLRSCTSPYVCVMCVVCVGWARAVCQNKILSLILLILLAKLMNLKKGIYRYCILYPYDLGPRSLMMLNIEI